MSKVLMVIFTIMIIYVLAITSMRVARLPILEQRLELIEEREDCYTFKDKVSKYEYVVPKNQLNTM